MKVFDKPQSPGVEGDAIQMADGRVYHFLNGDWRLVHDPCMTFDEWLDQQASRSTNPERSRRIREMLATGTGIGTLVYYTDVCGNFAVALDTVLRHWPDLVSR